VSNPAATCELCREDGGEVLWRDGFCRIVLVADPHYPGFCRVILERHAAEMTDLDEAERARLMRAVFATERALRTVLAPDKVNLASLGNVVPHLHWHVVPRFRDDRHFPAPIWAAPAREPAPGRSLDRARLVGLLAAAL
jgi:diadenosine tetraphosphate (Ap4A) HIT family hydrolase